MMTGKQEGPGDPLWWERLARTESATENLTVNVQQLARTIETLGQSVSINIQRIESRMSTFGQTDWKALSGWAAVVMSVIAMVGGALGVGFMRDMSRMEKYVESHEAWEKAQSSELDFERGQAAQQREDLRTAVANLVINLQREMRDVNGTTEAKLAELDRRVQGEVANVSTLLSSRMDAMSGDRYRASDAARDLKALDERFKYLERQLFEKPLHLNEP